MYGGSPADIAAAIWRKAPPGIDMNGDTTFTVADEEYDPPYPEYVITWQTLKPVSLHVSVTLKKVTICPQILPNRYSNLCCPRLTVQMVVCGQG